MKLSKAGPVPPNEVHNMFHTSMCGLDACSSFTVFRETKKILFDEAKSYSDIQLTHNYKNYKDRVSKFNKALLSISNPNLILYDFSNLICDDIANRCITSDNKGLLYRDDDHLSPHGASMIATDFTNTYSERIKFFKIDELKYKTN